MLAETTGGAGMGLVWGWLVAQHLHTMRRPWRSGPLLAGATIVLLAAGWMLRLPEHTLPWFGALMALGLVLHLAMRAGLRARLTVREP